MINTTDFLNALRLFENAADSKHLPTEFKIKERDNLLDEVEKLKDQINEVDWKEEIPDIIQRINNALKDL